jgi:hypothetical protein
MVGVTAAVVEAKSRFKVRSPVSMRYVSGLLD